MEELIISIVSDKIEISQYHMLEYDQKIHYINTLKDDEDAILKLEEDSTIDILKESQPKRNIDHIRKEFNEYFKKDENHNNQIIDKIYKNVNQQIHILKEEIYNQHKYTKIYK